MKKNKWILIVVLIILIGASGYIYTDSIEKEKIKEEKKREVEKEKNREKQKKPLTQKFIDKFHENFEYGMTQAEVKRKLGEPWKITGEKATQEYIYKENENGGYYDRSTEWNEWSDEIKIKNSYTFPDEEPTSCFVYKVDSKEVHFVYFYFTDEHFSRLNFV